MLEQTLHLTPCISVAVAVAVTFFVNHIQHLYKTN